MNILINLAQIGWDALRLTTNAGAISVMPAGAGQVKLSTLDKSQFDSWCSALEDAGSPSTIAKPAGQ